MRLEVHKAFHILDDSAAHSRGICCRQGGAIQTVNRSLKPSMLLAKMSSTACDCVFQHDVRLQSS